MPRTYIDTLCMCIIVCRCESIQLPRIVWKGTQHMHVYGMFPLLAPGENRQIGTMAGPLTHGFIYYSSCMQLIKCICMVDLPPTAFLDGSHYWRASPNSFCHSAWRNIYFVVLALAAPFTLALTGLGPVASTSPLFFAFWGPRNPFT